MFLYVPSNLLLYRFSRISSTLVFMKSTYYCHIFFTKYNLSITFSKMIKIYHSTAVWFSPVTNFFFWHPTQFMVVFTVLANFLHQILPRKKNNLYMKRYIFFRWYLGFFLLSAIRPQNKLRYHIKNITFATQFFYPIWHKTWLSCFWSFKEREKIFPNIRKLANKITNFFI